MPLSFYIRSDNDFLNSVMWIPEKSRGEGVVFCHGWGGGTPYDDLLKILADQGYTVLRFEQRGYGNSTGRGDLSLWPVDMAACAAVLKGAVKKVWAAGQSTGGTMALVAAATQDCFAGAISLAPFCSLPRILEDNPNARSVLEGRFGPLQEKHFRTANALEIVDGFEKTDFNSARHSRRIGSIRAWKTALREIASHRSISTCAGWESSSHEC